jgi:hypothetical protein
MRSSKAPTPPPSPENQYVAHKVMGNDEFTFRKYPPLIPPLTDKSGHISFPMKLPSDEHMSLMCRYLKNKDVIELGSGDLANAGRVSRCAESVVGIEVYYQLSNTQDFLNKKCKKITGNLWQVTDRVLALAETFSKALKNYSGLNPEACLTIWPAYDSDEDIFNKKEAKRKFGSGDKDGIEFMDQSDVIAYFGSNNDGVIAGGMAYWHYLMHREVLAYSDTQHGYYRHSAYVYGPGTYKNFRKMPLVQEFSVLFGLTSYQLKEIKNIHKKCLQYGFFKRPSYSKIKNFLDSSGFNTRRTPLGSRYEELYP